jgi:hypothetical protein
VLIIFEEFTNVREIVCEPSLRRSNVRPVSQSECETPDIPDSGQPYQAQPCSGLLTHTTYAWTMNVVISFHLNPVVLTF